MVYDNGIPIYGFWSDNAVEFQNEKMDKFVIKHGLTVRFGPAYSPWRNGINKWNHGITDKI